ncbi:MAG: nitronate monooxygenase [Proteobacteria bacterium]|nr:nitronate monooxygenase [Pseudomonadota bacterium]
MKNRLTRILSVDYPLIQGPMRLLTLGAMAAAVSAAGGFGQIAASGLTGERLREEIEKARRLTDRPFGVNIPLHRSNALEALEIAIEMGIKAITTSGGNPARVMDRVGQAGLKVLHKVSTVALGLKAQAAGVDGVIGMGFEAGGHGGREQITTFCLVPQLADALDVPVVAAGGIGDARGLVAALALGAEGAEMGTRLAATLECPAPGYFHEALLAAGDCGTLVLGQDIMPLRVLRNELSEALVDPARAGSAGGLAGGYLEAEGDMEHSIMPAGQAAGLIDRVVSIDELFSELKNRAGRLAAGLNDFFKEGAR